MCIRDRQVDAGVRHGPTAVGDDLRRPTLLVIGAEAAGVDSQWLEAADQHVRIPLRAPVESLNAAVAAGVLLFEAQRQRVDA